MEEVELIESYFNKSLSEADQLKFEEKMNADEAFRQRAENHFHFLQSLHEYAERKAVKESLNNIHEEIRSESANNNTKSILWKNWSTIAIAASVALICTIGTFFALQF